MDPVTASYLRRCYRHNVRSRELPRIRFRALNDNLDPAFAAWREGILNSLSDNLHTGPIAHD